MAAITGAIGETVDKPVWTIAILTIPEREIDFIRLIAVLQYQLHLYGPDKVDISDRVELLVNSRELDSVSAKRQWCLDNAQGEYFNFIDDDDLVAHDYVSSIFPLLDGEVDYIGFQCQHFLYGVKSQPTYHSLRYDHWYNDEAGFYRNITHLNPIKTEIARQGRYFGYYGEDHRWSQQVRPETEHYVDKVMYMYYDAPKYSAARAQTKERASNQNLEDNADGNA